MATTPFTLLVIIVVLVLIMPFLATVSGEYSGSANYTASINGLSYNISTTYSTQILAPLIGNPSNTVASNSNSLILKNIGYSNDMTTASSLFGFAFAFILPNLINILIQLLYIPQMIGQAVGTLLAFIPMNPLQGTIMSSQVTGLGWLFLGLMFVGAWLKYPLA